MTCSKAVEIIKNYKRRYLFPPRANWSDYQFRLRSYSRYFADKLIDMLCEAPIGTDPIFIVERLEDSIDDWMVKCDWQVQYRFGAISLEAIRDIHELLLWLDDKKEVVRQNGNIWKISQIGRVVSRETPFGNPYRYRNWRDVRHVWTCCARDDQSRSPT